jgi:phospholipid transport system substrate-binding protein
MKTLLRALAAVTVLGVAIPAWAGAPTDQVRQYTDQVLKVLEDPSLRTEERRFERRAAVRKIAIDIFDVSETARRVLGPHWQARTPAEREEFTQLFAELLEAAYISKIDLFGGERIKYVSEAIDGDHAKVRASIVTRQSTEVPVEARMIRRGDRWLIYDIAVENVSLIANYRSQFDRIIRTSSYQELVRRLKERKADTTNDKEPRARRTAS